MGRHKNRIREIRRGQSLTQRELAEAAGTSQQQIQRVESGVQAVRQDLAQRIAAALRTPLEEVFPASGPRIRRRITGNTGPHRSPAIDSSVYIRGLKYRLRGGAEGLLRLADGESAERLRSIIAEDDDRAPSFAVFDTHDRRVAVNTEHLVFCHFLCDPDGGAFAPQEAGKDERTPVRVWLAGDSEPLEFGVLPDLATPKDAEDSHDGSGSPNQNLFLELDGLEPEQNQRIPLRDEDGEWAYFLARDVAMISMPLDVVEPDLRDAMDEADEEDETRSASLTTAARGGTC